MNNSILSIQAAMTVLFINTSGEINATDHCLGSLFNIPTELQDVPTLESFVYVVSEGPVDAPVIFEHVANPFTEENLYFRITLTKKENEDVVYFECIINDTTEISLKKQQAQQVFNQAILEKSM